MSVRISILRIYGLSQGLYYIKSKVLVLLGLSLYLLGQIILQEHQLKGMLYTQDKTARNYGLPYKIHRPECQTLCFRILIFICGKEDDGRTESSSALLPVNRQGLKTVHLGHLNIHQYKIRFIILDKIKKCLPRLQGCNAHIVLTQYIADKGQVGHIIINYYNPVRTLFFLMRIVMQI